jgi:cellulose 1,4-beta-cellobiosidase
MPMGNPGRLRQVVGGIGEQGAVDDDRAGLIIDTSRNGWGGPDRPEGPGPGRARRPASTSTSTAVASTSASTPAIGERLTAFPAAGIHAYAWVKPPGESDGSSEEIPNDEGKGFDRM